MRAIRESPLRNRSLRGHLCPWQSPTATHNGRSRPSPTGCMLGFEDFMENKAQHDADHIEDQIVDVAAAQQGKKLGQLHQNNDQGGSKKASEKFVELCECPRQ